MSPCFVQDLGYAVYGADHHALLDVRFVVAFADELDDVSILGELLTHVLNHFVYVGAGLVFGTQLGVVAPWVKPALHKVEQVSKNEYSRPKLLSLVKVPVQEFSVALLGIVVDVTDEQEVLCAFALFEVGVDLMNRAAFS